MRRPYILVTLDEGVSERRGVSFPRVEAKAAYAWAVERAGGVPLWVAAGQARDDVDALLAIADGVVVTGGAFDIPPELYGADAGDQRLDTPKPARTRFEYALLQGAIARALPVLGVCGGMQLLNVVLGGSLVVDIRTRDPSALEHEQPTSPADGWHPIVPVPGTLLAARVGPGPHAVNSTHHQACDRLGDGLVVSARAPDGVVEAIERGPRITGVQWHPELQDDAVSRALYGALIEEAARAQR